MTPTGHVILLAYAGDFESSAAVAWLEEQYQTDVVTMTLDLGQGTDLADVRDRALALGAVRAHVLDVREEFARTAVAPALALGVGDPRVAALARPMVAKYLAQVAAIEGTAMVAHGSHVPQSDAGGLDALVAAGGGDLRVMAPCRDWALAPAQVLHFAKARGVPLPSAVDHLSAVRNLWGRALTGNLLSDPWAEVPPADYTLTRPVADWSATPAMLDLEFADGVPVSLNGVAMPLIELLPSLETIAGSHGLGRLDFPAIAGVRPRIVEEAPAPLVLHHAMKALSAVVPALWPAVRGTVRLQCHLGECHIEEVTI